MRKNPYWMISLFSFTASIAGGSDRIIMKTIISIAVLGFLLVLNATRDSQAGAQPDPAAQQPEYSQLKADAERAYAQGTYIRAHEIYAKVDKARLSPAEARWVEF